MQWQDEGVVIGTRRYGETSAIVEVMTATHGRHLGLVRGGRSRRMRPVLQPGNFISVIWRARLDEHLGTFQAEPLALNAARLLGSAVSVYGIQLLAAHLRLLPERDPHPELYAALKLIIDHLDRPLDAAELVARFELLMLEELGFGLDLSSCAATGLQDDLAFVSPKTGRAVSRAAGMPWSDKMLELPEFMAPGERGKADNVSFVQAFRLTGFFFSRHVWEARGTSEPESRTGFAAAVSKALKAEKASEGE